MTRLLLSALLALIPSIAMGHTSEHGMNYPAFCCSGSTGGVPSSVQGDCQAIPDRTVRAIQGGYEINLQPGDHHMTTVPAKFFVPYGKERKSEDGAFHLCLFPTEKDNRCFFAPDMGY